MVLLIYLKEIIIRGYFLGVCLLLSFSVVFLYREEFVIIFAKPYWAYIRSGSFIYTGLGEVFQTYLGLGFVVSLCILVIMFGINLYLFILPGLYQKERKLLNKVLMVANLLLGGSLVIIHKYIVKGVCSYLVGYSEIKGKTGLEYIFEPRILEFVKFVVRLDILFSIIFLGLISYFIYLWLNKNQNMLVEHIKQLRQWVYISILLTIIIVLPADFILHLIAFIVSVFSYEILIILLLLLKNYEFAWWNW